MTRPILLIDNYDSFTYNLYQYLGELGAVVQTHRNDRINVAQIQTMAPAGIVISPGPGRPEDAGVSAAVIEALRGQLPILGVCLGHQAIGLVHGGRIVRAPQIMHGKVSEILHDGAGIFRGLPEPFAATRYHSLVIAPEDFPGDVLEISAKTEDGVIMGVRHKQFPSLEGVQFHPESILTDFGKRMLANFLEGCGLVVNQAAIATGGLPATAPHKGS